MPRVIASHQIIIISRMGMNELSEYHWASSCYDDGLWRRHVEEAAIEYIPVDVLCCQKYPY